MGVQWFGEGSSFHEGYVEALFHYGELKCILPQRLSRNGSIGKVLGGSGGGFSFKSLYL